MKDPTIDVIRILVIGKGEGQTGCHVTLLKDLASPSQQFVIPTEGRNLLSTTTNVLITCRFINTRDNPDSRETASEQVACPASEMKRCLRNKKPSVSAN